MRNNTAASDGVIKTAFSCMRAQLTIRGYEFRQAGENQPIAIVCHGFMANHKMVAHFARRLASWGYAAYCFDFCGGCVAGGKSKGKTTEMSVLTEVEDLEAVLAYAKALPYTAAQGTLLMGCSQGGLVCALTAAKRGAEIEQLALLYPALCIPDDARAGKMMFARFDPQNVPKTLWCGPMHLGRRYVTDVLDMDPYREIAPYPGDVLIVHGTDDQLVNIRYSRRAKDVYDARSGARGCRLVCIEGATHMFSKEEDEKALDAIREFVKN